MCDFLPLFFMSEFLDHSLPLFFLFRFFLFVVGCFLSFFLFLAPVKEGSELRNFGFEQFV